MTNRIVGVHDTWSQTDAPVRYVDLGGEAAFAQAVVPVSPDGGTSHVIVDSMPAGGAGLTDAELRSAPVPVDVTFSSLPTGAATEARQNEANALLAGLTTPADTQPVSGPVTNAQLRASPVPVSGTVGVTGTVPVSGTFYQATQPISAAVIPLPTGAAAEATLAAIKARTDNLDVLLSTRTKPGDTQPVSGTFWPATQPVSGPLTDAQMRASAVPVSGAFFQATQPVSAAALPLPVGAATEATLAGRLPTPVAKGVQGATAQAVQDLKDSGRSLVSIKAVAATGATTEALVSLVKTLNGVEAAGATTIAVTAGKTLRITTMIVTWRNNTAALGAVQCRLRMNPVGAAIVTSPVLATCSARSAAATIGDVDTKSVIFPEGLEFSGTNQLAVTQVALGAVVGYDVELCGYEY